MSEFLEQVNYLADNPIIVVVKNDNIAFRQKQGWSFYNDRSVNVKKIIGFFSLLKIFLSNRKKKQIVCGIGGNVYLLFLGLLSKIFQSEVYFISEPYSPIPLGYFKDSGTLLEKFKCFIRPFLYRYIYRLIWPKPKIIFCISDLSKQQFEKAGFNKNSFFDFYYFIRKEKVRKKRTFGKENNLIKLVYAGSLNRRKGVDVLVEAVKNFHAKKRAEKNLNLSLDIFSADDWKKLEIDKNCPKIAFKGRYQQIFAQKLISKYDILVLPSRYDGWGAVVNEAICQGLGVIVSNSVGAKKLVEYLDNGMIFETNEPAKIEEIFEFIYSNPSIIQHWKNNSSKSYRFISPKKGARYFLKSIKYVSSASLDKPRLW